MVTLLPQPGREVDCRKESPRNFVPTEESRLDRIAHPEEPWVASGEDSTLSMLGGSAAGHRGSAAQHVLIVANTCDPEADRLAATIAARGDTFVHINIEDLQSSLGVNCHPDASISESTLTHGDITTSLADFCAAWAPVLDRGSFGHALNLPPASCQTLQDSSWALCDLARWMPCLWVNDPAAVGSASDGLLQLRVAGQVGLEIPRTIITNDPAQARAFQSQLSGDIVTRAVGHHRRATNLQPLCTRGQILDAQALELMDEVALAPTILQENSSGWSRLRIYLVGDLVFPISIPMSLVDAFIGYSESVADLPAEVQGQCRLLLRRLGLVFAAIDLARTRDGRYVFLDLIPAPTWLWLEERTGLPITAALVDLLTTPCEHISLDQTVGDQLPYG